MGSFLVLPSSWVRHNPAVGLFIAGMLLVFWREQFKAPSNWSISSVYTGLCTFYFIYKIVTVLYIFQFYAEQHIGARYESPLTSIAVFSHDGITILFIKIQNTNTLESKSKSALLSILPHVRTYIQRIEIALLSYSLVHTDNTKH